MKEGLAVVDTNVVVSGVLTAASASPTATILDGMLAGRFRFLLSVELIAEYREVLLRPKIRARHRLSESEGDVRLKEIAVNGVVLDVEPAAAGRRKRDDHIRSLFSAAPSAVLVTGDQELVDEMEKKARVLTPRAFAENLGDEEG